MRCQCSGGWKLYWRDKFLFIRQRPDEPHDKRLFRLQRNQLHDKCERRCEWLNYSIRRSEHSIREQVRRSQIAVNTGYNITNVLVDGSSVGTPNSYTFNNVQTNHTISAWFGGSGTTGFGAWWNNMTIAFFGYNKPETLTNFPVLVVLSTNISSFSYSQFASTNGYDLRFSADGLTELNYEIEQWNPSGNSYVWVQVPQLASSSYIWAYWNNPGAASGPAAYTINGAVWPTNAFAAVWHMNQPNAKDSTANTNNGTANNSVGSAPGVIGNGAKYGRFWPCQHSQFKQSVVRHESGDLFRVG